MNYKEIVLAVEADLEKIKMNNISVEDFKSRLERYKHFNYITLKDDEIFWMLTYIMFFNMGKKASMIEKKLPILKSYLYGYEKLTKLSSDEIEDIIENTGFQKQVNWVVSNAKVFNNLIKQYNSFKEYLEKEFGIKDIYCSNQQLSWLYEDLKLKFTGIGETAGWHFITELGFFSLKPDSVIRRIFYRLGLIENENNLLEAIEVGREISKELEIPIRYIDIIFVKFGQVGESNLLGTVDGICTENNPKCYMCTLKNICKYKSDEIKYVDIPKVSEIIEKEPESYTNTSVINRNTNFKDIPGDTIWELGEFVNVIQAYFGSSSKTFKIINEIGLALNPIKSKINVKKRKGNDLVIKFKQGGNILTLWLNKSSLQIRIVGDDIFDKQRTIYNLETLQELNTIKSITKKASLA